jgi:hypothetical protein
MITDGTMADFERTNMAWLTGEGELLTCPMHSHIERLATVPAFADAYARYQAICDDNETFKQEELESLGPDEHPSMHRYDGMNDDAKAELVKAVYTAGWIRIGRTLDSSGYLAFRATGAGSMRDALSERTLWYVEAEGLTESVRRHDAILRRLAERSGCRLVPREMKYLMVRIGGRTAEPRELLVPEAYDEPND